MYYLCKNNTYFIAAYNYSSFWKTGSHAVQQIVSCT